MVNLQVIAHLGTPLAVFDDWSPTLDAMLVFQILDRLGLATANPTAQDCEHTAPIVQREMPLERREIKGQWYWAVSSPHYMLEAEQTVHYNKQWDCLDRHLDWGKKRAVVNTASGHFKSYKMPRYDRLVRTVHWFCVGEREGILSLVQTVTHIGKKRSQGCGQVLRWEVVEVPYDWHLWRNGHLARPVPVGLIPRPHGATILNWGWRPPFFLPENKTLCYMPTSNICRSSLEVG